MADRGKMIKWAVLGGVGLLAVVYIGAVFGFRGDCVRAEAGIKAQYEQNKNSYDNMWKQFKELAQVPEMYVKDMKEVWTAAVQGRYGDGGSKAVLQFIKEHNPQLDSPVYTKLQSAIEAGRNSFKADQQQLIDKKREYEQLLLGNKALFVNSWLGFPRIDLNQYAIVTSEQTDEAFKSKKAGEIRLR